MLVDLALVDKLGVRSNASMKKPVDNKINKLVIIPQSRTPIILKEIITSFLFLLALDIILNLLIFSVEIV